MVVHSACSILSSTLYVIQTMYNCVYTEQITWMVRVDRWKYQGHSHE